jgi:hypothetical protein
MDMEVDRRKVTQGSVIPQWIQSFPTFIHYTLGTTGLQRSCYCIPVYISVLWVKVGAIVIQCECHTLRARGCGHKGEDYGSNYPC